MLFFPSNKILRKHVGWESARGQKVEAQWDFMVQFWTVKFNTRTILDGQNKEE